MAPTSWGWRLDLASTGLLLLTNDTRLAAWLTDPATALSRVYVVTVRGSISDAAVARIEAGLEAGGEWLSAQRVGVRKRSGLESHLVVEFVEGKNREIRRLFDAVGHEVTSLKRVSFGGVTLGDLPPGQWRLVIPTPSPSTFPRAPRPDA